MKDFTPLEGGHIIYGCDPYDPTKKMSKKNFGKIFKKGMKMGFTTFKPFFDLTSPTLWKIG